MRVIRGTRGGQLSSVLLGMVAVACAGEPSTSPDPASLAPARPPVVSGRLLGPDGDNICQTIGNGTLLVRLLNPEFGITSDEAFLGAQDIKCPQNRFSLPFSGDSAYLRVELPAETRFDSLPWRHLETISVGGASVNHDVTVREGTTVSGLATLDGERFEGVFLQFLYELNNSFGATNTTSDAGGSWTEFFGRTPAVLQNSVRYSVFSTCGSMLGTRLIEFLDNGTFQFPEGVRSVNCTLRTGAATQFSHRSTRLVVTPMPGDIGGSFSPDFFDQYGVGWGVQFPVERGSTPQHDPGFSEIFNGGLLIGIGTDQVLAGADAGSMMACGATCRDLGLNGAVKFTSQRDGSKSVTWRYSDATSAEPAGLEVTQVSTDGKQPNDYVLFRFSIRNTRAAPVTFHAGVFGDWDIDLDAADDLGATELGGKLVYQTSAAETGIHVGTLLLGAPATGSFFFDGSEGAFPSTVDQVQALKGELRRETAGAGDLRYIQGAGPITLKRGQAKDLWVAVVAGQDRAALLANAAAAESDAARRAGSSLDVAGLTLTSGASSRLSSAARAQPVCKNCQSK